MCVESRYVARDREKVSWESRRNREKEREDVLDSITLNQFASINDIFRNLVQCVACVIRFPSHE